MQIFITGTDTNVGKTLVSTWLCNSYNFNYWKPVQSGDEDGVTDTDFVKKVCNYGREEIAIHDPVYSFKEAIAPHLAATANNVEIDLGKIFRSRPRDRKLIIEGAGGVFVPLNKKFLMIDLIEILEIPVIIVARSDLGTINHTLLTINALRDRNIKIFGVIMNGDKNEGNKKAIEFYGEVEVLFEFPVLKNKIEDMKDLDYVDLFMRA